MDIISQLQDQVNKIAYLAFNTVGTLQRDAPPSRLSHNYPDPANAAAAAAAAVPQAPQGQQQQQQQQKPEADQASAMASALVQAAKQFDALVDALPVAEGGEEAQLRRIAELQAENEKVGRELQLELEAADEQLKQVRELFHAAADDCLHLKPLQ